MNLFSSSLLALVILAYCFINAISLLFVWMQLSFFEQYTWTILLVWLIPVFYYWIVYWKEARQNHQFNPILLGGALFFSLIGNIGALNSFNYLGLALAITAFVPWTYFTFIWLFCSFTWMPGTSWFASYMAITHLFFVRLVIAIVASALLIYNIRKRLSGVVKCQQ
jgi:hypothetical protein